MNKRNRNEYFTHLSKSKQHVVTEFVNEKNHMFTKLIQHFFFTIFCIICKSILKVFPSPLTQIFFTASLILSVEQSQSNTINMFQLDEREMSTYSPEDQKKKGQRDFLKNIVIFGVLVFGLQVTRTFLARQ